MRNNNLKKVLALALLFTASSAFAAATKPGAPRWVTATADGGYNITENTVIATVTFSPPASNGGATITSYTVNCSPACIPSSGPTSPIRVGGLTEGIAYTFTVTATNSAGTGVPSDVSNSAPVCDGSNNGGNDIFGYINTRNPAQHHSIKVDGSNSGSCKIETGCEGFIDFRVDACSNNTGHLTNATLNYGPSYDNTLVDAFYYVKHSHARAQFSLNSVTREIEGIYAK